MKKSKNYFGLWAITGLLFFNYQAPGQSFQDSLAQDDHDIVSSIAPYAPDVRAAILDVAQYPQVLVKLERIQSRSSQSFQDMIAQYPREDQEKFYELSRFPDIVNQLTSHGKLNQNDVKAIVKDLPSATQFRLQALYDAHFDDLVKMNKLYQSSQTALQKIISSYPQNVQADFQKIITMPDVMNLLTDNINLAVSLGESYKADPTGVKQQLDSLSNKLSQQNAQDLSAYKKEVESDPKMQTEMKQAATDFSTSYDQPDDPNYVSNSYYDNYPYPYWFSYPYWYPSPIWYPRPIWYHTGFYYGAGGALVVVGLPSRLYSNWFFGVGYRRYPTLYSHYNTYYNLHRANIRNVNVYRGFNNAAHEHFSSVNRGAGNVGRLGAANPRANAPVSRSQNRPAGNNAAVRSSQMNVHSENFNSRGIQNFHANTYHSMGWQNVGGARSSSGGGFRSSGGGGSRGGGGGGGGGRRR